MSFDYYATLGVSPTAPAEVIRAAYRALAQKHHPDRNKQDPEAEKITVRLNEAYRVLSDENLRRAYDAQYTSAIPQQISEKSSDMRRASPMIHGEAAGHAFMIQFVPGQIISNDLWTETHAISKKTMSFTSFGIQPRIRMQVIPCQRIGVSTAGGNIMVQQSGSHIPLANGQNIELVQIFSEDRSRDGIVAIVNRSVGRWFWIGSNIEAGKLLRNEVAGLIDTLVYAAAVAISSGLIWELLRRTGGLLVAAGFFLFGVPALFHLASPLLLRTAKKIAEGVGEKIHSEINAKR